MSYIEWFWVLLVISLIEYAAPLAIIALLIVFVVMLVKILNGKKK